MVCGNRGQRCANGGSGYPCGRGRLKPLYGHLNAKLKIAKIKQSLTSLG